jgi:flagellar biogenesis protein FliO
MKNRTPWLPCAAFVIVSAAAPALAQSNGHAETNEGRRTSERERERDSNRDDARTSRDSRDSRDARDDRDSRDDRDARGRADAADTKVAAREHTDREAARDGAKPEPSEQDDGASETPRNVDRDGATQTGSARETKPSSGSAGSRSWLAASSTEPAIAATEANGSSHTGLTIGAVLLVLGLAAAAIAMRFRKRDALPLAPSEARLTVLSSSRVGPKAFAVTAHVNGRPLLLGVTDHTVTLLGWLDAREPSVTEAAHEPEPELEEELPEDYPGSALRASRVPTFASSSRLERFQEVLRGAEESRADLPMRPSYAPSPLDAASLLAAQTSDVVTSSQTTALAKAPQAVAAVSLRRKRRSRESLAPREPRSTLVSRTPKGVDPSMEGQVAGLRALRNGG